MKTSDRTLKENPDARALPLLLRKATALEAYAINMGIAFGYPPYSGVRTEADTLQLIRWRDDAVRKGGAAAYYPVAPYGRGYHPWGSAFDIKVVKVPAGKTIAWGYATLGAYAPSLGLRWGGTFSGKNVDPYHFELAVSLAEAQKLWTAHAGAGKPVPGPTSPGVPIILTPAPAPVTEPMRLVSEAIIQPVPLNKAPMHAIVSAIPQAQRTPPGPVSPYVTNGIAAAIGIFFASLFKGRR